MSTQFFLNETDIEILTKLLVRSQQLRKREALCGRIGIDSKQLPFIRDSSDSDFFLLLINHLNDIGQQEALCKLCCKELLPVFRGGKYATVLSEIATKLNCEQRLSQNYNIQPPDLPRDPDDNPFNQRIKNKLVMGGTIILIGLAGFSLFNQNKNSNPPSTHQYQLKATNSKGIAIPGKQGQTVTIKAQGKVHTRLDGTVPDCDKWTGPNGIPECKYVKEGTLPYHDEPFMALIGQFEDEPPFVVGNMYKYEFKKTGNLLIIINDTDYGDSAGAFRIETTITN
jgi:hypothetical protein